MCSRAAGDTGCRNVGSSSYCHDWQKRTATAKYLSPVCTLWSWLYTCLHKCRQKVHVRIRRTKRCATVIFSTGWLTCSFQSVKLKQVPCIYREEANQAVVCHPPTVQFVLTVRTDMKTITTSHLKSKQHDQTPSRHWHDFHEMLLAAQFVKTFPLLCIFNVVI